MSGLSSYSYTTIKQSILDYTEVDSNVFTTTILDGFIMAAEHRINLRFTYGLRQIQGPRYNGNGFK